MRYLILVFLFCVQAFAFFGETKECVNNRATMHPWHVVQRINDRLYLVADDSGLNAMFKSHRFMPAGYEAFPLMIRYVGEYGQVEMSDGYSKILFLYEECEMKRGEWK